MPHTVPLYAMDQYSAYGNIPGATWDALLIYILFLGFFTAGGFFLAIVHRSSICMVLILSKFLFKSVVTDF